MPFINDLFIDVYTSGITDVNLYTESIWDETGLPLIKVHSSGNVPDGMMLKTLMYPSGDMWSGDDLIDLLSDGNIYRLNNYITNSGYYYGSSFVFDGSGVVYNREHNINKSHANQHYTMGYILYFADDYGEQQVYEPVASSLSDLVLTKANKPLTDNINVISNLYSEEVSSSDLWLRIYRTSELNNYDLSAPDPYLVIISGIQQQVYYNPSGDIIGSEYNGSNYFSDSVPSGMFLSLPYLSGAMNSAHEYDISLINIDQEGTQSPRILFNTKDIKTSSDDFNEGQLDLFESINVKKIGEIPIKNDVITKKRLMIGIEDIVTVNTQYSKKGSYVSQYYNMDSSIYTFSMSVGETIPTIVNVHPYDIVKYYVQFHDQDWIRMSPINRGDEFNNRVVVPKFLVLDQLNIGNISTQISQHIYNFPVYSFRIKIEIDMSFSTGINYVSPAILYYECHVTDRNYAIGMNNEQ